MNENEQGYILVMGLGLYQGGLGVAEHFAKKGEKVIVTDLLTEKELQTSIEPLKKYPNIQFVLGQHRDADFTNAKMIFANPRVPPTNKFLEIARAKNIPIHTEMSYYFENKQNKVIGITGTRGKSTTTNLTYQILQHAAKNVFLGGSIGVSVMPLLERLDPNLLAVLEISNLMLEYMRDMEQSPEIAAITNISVDHLDRHKTMEEYVNVKSTIFRFQPSDGIVVLNSDNEYTDALKSDAKGKVITVGIQNNHADYTIRDGIVHEHGKPLFPISGVIEDVFHSLAGKHNEYNILTAIALSRTQNVATEAIEEALINYEGLYGRQMYLGEIKGVHTVNDTCANSPEGAIQAIKKYQEFQVILITGGTDVELDFSAMAKSIKGSSVKAVVVLKGSASDKLVKALEDENIDTPIYAGMDSLEEAVGKAFKLAAPKDLILFSPGCKSFEMFVNQTERGHKFDEIVEQFK